MISLGTLNGGTWSGANPATVTIGPFVGISADGRVIVGAANDGAHANVQRAFRWTQATGMQTVEDWLRASGVRVPADITVTANATNSDGSVVVGHLASGTAYIARGASGLVTLADVQDSLYTGAAGTGMGLAATGTVINGAHSNPLARRVAADKKAFWLAGDWGRDEHGGRSGSLGLAEVGGGVHAGPVQLNVALGQTWYRQSLALNGGAKTDGTYLLAEALIPVSGNLWATLGSYYQWGNANLRRGYLNAGALDASSATPGTATWGLRARLDWENAARLGDTGFTPYADLSYGEAKMDAYTETGGGFPARFDARKDKATDLRVGMNASQPLASGEGRFLATLEAAHRFESTGARTSGEVIGLTAFDLPGQANKRDWLRAGAGVEGKLGGGTASVMLNATTQGPALSAWLAASWMKAF